VEVSIAVARIQGEIMIERPVEVVFDFVADERNEPRYNPQLLSVEQTTSGPIGVGTQFRAQTMRAGRTIEMQIEFTAYERPQRLESATHLSSMDIRGDLTFVAVPGGTRMRWSWQVTPRGLFKLLTPIVGRMGQRQEETIWRSLKRLLEADVAPPARA
jgi:hypothetical protein